METKTELKHRVQADIPGPLSRVESFILLLVSAALVALCIIGVLYFVDGMDRQIERNDRLAWHTVEATVLSSSAKIVDASMTKLRISAKYSYEIGGQRYVGKQDWNTSCPLCGQYGNTVKEARLQYAPGTKVTVYYTSSKLGEAVIEQQGNWPIGWLILAILSGFIALFAAMGVLVGGWSFPAATAQKDTQPM